MAFRGILVKDVLVRKVRVTVVGSISCACVIFIAIGRLFGREDVEGGKTFFEIYCVSLVIRRW